jgi:hypothetical protein
MKRILFAALLFVAFSSALFSKEYVAEGKTHSSLGDYKISIADKPVTIDGQELKTYVISYQNSPMEVTVAIMKSKKCKNYLVLSDILSIQYVCNKDYFGVQILDEPLNKEGFTTSEEALNRNEYFHQKLIAPGKQDELVSTELIAAYFPRLIKDELVAIK